MLRSFVLAAALAAPVAASAQSCGNDAGGFEAWKQQFAQVAAANGVGERGLSALSDASYATRTIQADRNQKSFRYPLDEFLRLRGADTIVSQGQRMLERDRPFYDSLEAAYGVPAGILIAIHGMETGFGNFMGDANVISAITTLAYDCRRGPQFFQEHALAALLLVDRGAISPESVGAMHGELGHTQFLPANILRYGQDGNGDGVVDLTRVEDAMASTANFLRGHGWQPGLGYREGEPNFAVLGQWNAATVYQQALALMGPQIKPGS